MESDETRPLYRSRYGGLWVDRADAASILTRMLGDSTVTPEEAESLGHFISHGYVVFPRAIASDVIDDYVAFFERAWDRPPPGIYAHSGGAVHLLSRSLYDRVTKVSDLHYYFARAEKIVFPASVKRFLELIYEREAVVFQSMSMRKGSEEALHIDTGPLTLTEPLSLAGAWIALEDVRHGSGEFQFVPGSHRTPEVLNNGVSKAHNNDFAAYHAVLEAIRRQCETANLSTKYFMAKKGDVLIWAADLMHGGAPIRDHTLTRQSLVFHYMPHGVMPTFYDFSKVHYLAYPNGGYFLDRIIGATGY
jgi:phytanoyl-CoA hydroxylase